MHPITRLVATSWYQYKHGSRSDQPPTATAYRYAPQAHANGSIEQLWTLNSSVIPLRINTFPDQQVRPSIRLNFSGRPDRSGPQCLNITFVILFLRFHTMPLDIHADQLYIRIYIDTIPLLERGPVCHQLNQRYCQTTIHNGSRTPGTSGG